VIAEPFGPVVPAVPLPGAPLVFVVAQARFERIASIVAEEFIAAFQEAIRGSYPKLRREQQTAVLIGPDGRLLTTDAGTVWRFDEHPERWQVALSPDSVALSTASYTSRSDFMGRLRAVLSSAQRHLGLQFCDRIGVRYVDRITDGTLLARLAELIKPEVRGPVGAALGEAGVEQVHSFSDTTYGLPDNAELHARWGVLPAHATIDPAIAAAEVGSWVLDIDAYTREQETFDAPTLTARAERLCERIYRFFRWTVDDEFLAAHGGRP